MPSLVAASQDRREGTTMGAGVSNARWGGVPRKVCTSEGIHGTDPAGSSRHFSLCFTRRQQDDGSFLCLRRSFEKVARDRVLHVSKARRLCVGL